MIALSLTLALAATAMQGPSQNCVLSASDRAWIDRSYRAWEFVRIERLHVAEAERPIIVFFDARCRYEARPGGPMVWTGETHSGTIRVPNGTTVPAGVTSFAGGDEARGLVYFVMALPSVWSAANIRSPLGEDVLPQMVFLHEYMHTRQALFMGRLFEDWAARFNLPEGTSDDSIQERFANTPAYVADFERERDLLYAAANAPDLAQARAHARAALAAMRARQARWFTGRDAQWKPLDDAFLTMEGTGQWSIYAWLSDPRGMGLSPEAAQAQVRRGGGTRWWSQAEGFALLLTVDRLLPDWQSRVFSDTPLFGADLLAAAVDARPR